MVATLLRLVGIDVKRLARETAITIVVLNIAFKKAVFVH